jgi:hypothetical protein
VAVSVDDVARKGFCATQKTCGVALKTGVVGRKRFRLALKGLFVRPKGFSAIKKTGLKGLK